MNTTKPRADLGFEADPLDDFSPDEWQPKKPVARPDPAKTQDVAAASGFRSREPKPAAKSQRRHRTGRNVQLNIKVTQEVYDSFYDLVDRTGMVNGVVLEHAISALKEKLRTQGGNPE